MSCKIIAAVQGVGYTDFANGNFWLLLCVVVSAYALHILNNKHEYGNTEQTTELLKPCKKWIFGDHSLHTSSKNKTY